MASTLPNTVAGRVEHLCTEADRFMAQGRHNAAIMRYATAIRVLPRPPERWIETPHILAAMIDREKRGESLFRTVFLYPLAISLIVTGAAWRWMFNPELGVEHFIHSLGLTWVNASWLARPETAMYGVILASVWQSAGFYMALMLAGLKSINSEIWSAARLDGVGLFKLYTEIIIPMMKFTFVTCAILLSLGVIKAYDVIVAMTNGGPGQSTYVPAYFTIQALSAKGNLGFASAAAVLMLVITAAVFLPLVLLTAWQQRRSGATR